MNMHIGKAVAIVDQIDSDDYSTNEKGEAIYTMLNMATHNTITKKTMLKVIRWLFDMVFDVEEG